MFWMGQRRLGTDGANALPVEYRGTILGHRMGWDVESNCEADGGACPEAAASAAASPLRTRLATHGVTNANAHPHTDSHHQIAVVHNGVIEMQLLARFLSEIASDPRRIPRSFRILIRMHLEQGESFAQSEAHSRC